MVLDENFGALPLQVIEMIFPDNLKTFFPKITIMYAYMDAGGKLLIERADCPKISDDVAYDETMLASVSGQKECPAVRCQSKVAGCEEHTGPW